MAVSGRKNLEIASERLVEVLASAPVSVKSVEKKNENNELNKEKGQFQVVLPDQIHWPFHSERRSRRNHSVGKRRKQMRKSKLPDRRALLTLDHLVALASTPVDTSSIICSLKKKTFTKNRLITILQLQKSQKCQARQDVRSKIIYHELNFSSDKYGRHDLWSSSSWAWTDLLLKSLQRRIQMHTQVIEKTKESAD